MSEQCQLHERSARGYCPGEEDYHQQEREALLNDEGLSPEEWVRCMTYDYGQGSCGPRPEGVTNPVCGPTYDGNEFCLPQDEYAPETSTTMVPEIPTAQLPATGFDPIAWLLIAAGLIGFGFWFIREQI